jgi:hypothetical protein
MGESTKSFESEGHRLSLLESLPSIETHTGKVEFSGKDIARLLELLSNKDSRLNSSFASKQALERFKRKHFL